jgi:hypothetical protein
MKTLNMLHGDRAGAHAIAVVCYGSVHGITQHVGEDPRLSTRVSATIGPPAHFGASLSDSVLRVPLSIRSLLGNVEQKPQRLGDALGYSTRHGRSDVLGGRRSACASHAGRIAQ